MEGQIMNFRQGRKTHYKNHLIIKVNSVDNREAAKKLIDKQVVYKTKNGEIKGIVKSAHGNGGCLRVIFEKGMPGQSISGKVMVE